jgi:hypothetical protein
MYHPLCTLFLITNLKHFEHRKVLESYFTGFPFLVTVALGFPQPECISKP